MQLRSAVHAEQRRCSPRVGDGGEAARVGRRQQREPLHTATQHVHLPHRLRSLLCQPGQAEEHRATAASTVTADSTTILSRCYGHSRWRSAGNGTDLCSVVPLPYSFFAAAIRLIGACLRCPCLVERVHHRKRSLPAVSRARWGSARFVTPAFACRRSVPLCRQCRAIAHLAANVRSTSYTRPYIHPFITAQFISDAHACPFVAR